MNEHKIYARHSGVAKTDRLFIPLIKRCVWVALRFENVDIPCEVSVLVTNNHEIRKISNEFLGIDKSTDVLSFPMHSLVPGRFKCTSDMVDLATGLLPLGEIILSAERVDKQAQKYMHSRERETAFLTIHSVLHLLGYDHYGEVADTNKMRDHEKQIMWELGYSDD
jgi:probable rRNA maturation factor